MITQIKEKGYSEDMSKQEPEDSRVSIEDSIRDEMSSRRLLSLPEEVCGSSISDMFDKRGRLHKIESGDLRRLEALIELDDENNPFMSCDGSKYHTIEGLSIDKRTRLFQLMRKKMRGMRSGETKYPRSKKEKEGVMARINSGVNDYIDRKLKREFALDIVYDYAQKGVKIEQNLERVRVDAEEIRRDYEGCIRDADSVRENIKNILSRLQRYTEKKNALRSALETERSKGSGADSVLCRDYESKIDAINRIVREIGQSSAEYVGAANLRRRKLTRLERSYRKVVGVYRRLQYQRDCVVEFLSDVEEMCTEDAIVYDSDMLGMNSKESRIEQTVQYALRIAVQKKIEEGADFIYDKEREIDQWNAKLERDAMKYAKRRDETAGDLDDIYRKLEHAESILEI